MVLYSMVSLCIIVLIRCLLLAHVERHELPQYPAFSVPFYYLPGLLNPYLVFRPFAYAVRKFSPSLGVCQSGSVINGLHIFTGLLVCKEAPFHSVQSPTFHPDRFPGGWSSNISRLIGLTSYYILQWNTHRDFFPERECQKSNTAGSGIYSMTGCGIAGF